MSYQLNFDQLLEALTQGDHPKAAECQDMAEKLANHMAALIAEQHGVECSGGSFEGVAFAGLCVPFSPKYPGQPLPDLFAAHEFDSAEEWGA